MLGLLPILQWLPQYPIREYLPGDIISGASISVLHLPQGLSVESVITRHTTSWLPLTSVFAPLGLAYAPLAGLPAVYGLYASFYPVILYVIFGTSKHLSVGEAPSPE